MGCRVTMPIGSVCGRLTVTSAPFKAGPRGWYQVLARCACGSERAFRVRYLREGRSRTCGCGIGRPGSVCVRTHGASKTPEYRSWAAMHRRCLNPKHPCFGAYGRRGITICDRWLRNFPAFLEDMGPRPPGTSLDRIDPNGPYSPGNCRWATLREQADNRRNQVWIEHAGQRKTIGQWACERGLARRCLEVRLASGWSVRAALETPVRRRRAGRAPTAGPSTPAPRDEPWGSPTPVADGR
jgi:hypothetical protein